MSEDFHREEAATQALQIMVLTIGLAIPLAGEETTMKILREIISGHIEWEMDEITSQLHRFNSKKGD